MTGRTGPSGGIITLSHIRFCSHPEPNIDRRRIWARGMTELELLQTHSNSLKYSGSRLWWINVNDPMKTRPWICFTLCLNMLDFNSTAMNLRFYCSNETGNICKHLNSLCAAEGPNLSPCWVQVSNFAEFREQQKAACEKVSAEVLDPELCASPGYWTFMGVNRVSQRTPGKTELRACAGTAGDAGSRTRRSREAGKRCDLPVWAVVIVRIGVLLLADHHPAEQ